MLLRAILATRRGQLAAAADGLALLVLADLEAGPGAGWVALLAQAMGELDLARSHLGPALAAVEGGLLTADLERDPSQRAEIAALGLRIEADSATLARDHRDRATLDDCERAAMTFHAQARSDLAVDVARDSSMARVSWASVLDARLDGELARVRGDVDPDPWRRAIAVADQSSDDPARAYARLRLGECLLDHGRGRAEATIVLRECRALAEPLAAALILDPLTRLVERARLDVDGDRGRPDGDPVPGPRSAARRLGLSDREVDVLELLAQGMTDREIATHLFITEKTAGHHVSHILDKLAVARRGEAAALAHRLGLLGPATSAAEEWTR